MTGGVGVFICILILKEKASWTRRLGGIRQRAHPQRLRQRRQIHHATHGAQGRVQFQLASASSQHGRSLHDIAQFFKEATEGESSGDEFGILEDDRCIDTGVFQRRHLVHELVFACSPPPAAAPLDQPYHPDSFRLVCRSHSGPLRVGTPLPVITIVEAGSRVFCH